MDIAAFSYRAEHDPRGWTSGFCSWRYGLWSSEEAFLHPSPRVPLPLPSPRFCILECVGLLSDVNDDDFWSVAKSGEALKAVDGQRGGEPPDVLPFEARFLAKDTIE